MKKFLRKYLFPIMLVGIMTSVFTIDGSFMAKAMQKRGVLSVETPQYKEELLPSELNDRLNCDKAYNNTNNEGTGVAAQAEVNDYLSRTVATYDNINDQKVEVHTFFIEAGYTTGNPNFSQAVMVYQAIAYKKAHPEEHVTVTLTSFHLSVAFAACVVPGSADYGLVKNLYGAEYTDDGYYRLSYLLVEAAKYGIETLVVGQIDASPVTINGVLTYDYSFKAYFEGHLADDTYIPGKKVGDYMTFGYSAWKSYGGKQAADMMHNKTCTVSHRRDSAGNDLGPALWTGSINVDGIYGDGRNGHDSLQTATIITGHEEMRRVVYNYTKLLIKYPEQEDIVPFRVDVVARTTAQIDALENGEAVATDEQIVYLGTEKDNVFELYFTPFGGNFGEWNEKYNPYVKYISKLRDTAKTDDYIEFFWNNVKFHDGFELGGMILDSLKNSFCRSANKQNILYLFLPYADLTRYDSLQAGVNLEQKHVVPATKALHIKDLQLSYVENGERYWVTMFNSLNIHEGSMYHQTNTMIVVKETKATGNHLYIDYATMTAPEINMSARRVNKQ